MKEIRVYCLAGLIVAILSTMATEIRVYCLVGLIVAILSTIALEFIKK